jgi:hypothetical protein
MLSGQPCVVHSVLPHCEIVAKARLQLAHMCHHSNAVLIADAPPCAAANRKYPGPTCCEGSNNSGTHQRVHRISCDSHVTLAGLAQACMYSGLMCVTCTTGCLTANHQIMATCRTQVVIGSDQELQISAVRLDPAAIARTRNKDNNCRCGRPNTSHRCHLPGLLVAERNAVKQRNDPPHPP